MSIHARVAMGYGDLAPEHYALELVPDIEQSAFAGAVAVRVMADKPVDAIEMDCAELRITSCKVFLPGGDANASDTAAAANGGSLGGAGMSCLSDDDNDDDAIPKLGPGINIPDSMISTDEETERLAIRLPRGVRITGAALIKITFEGVLNDRLLGFYRSTYTHNKQTKHMATTQFEAADARRAFPCWDRPDAKATFQISVAVLDDRHTAISNMPVSHVKNRGKTRVFCFEPTPRMSTYLVYVGVGEFAVAKRAYSSGDSTVQIRVITTGAIPKNATRFAMECASKLLGLYESYFGIPYPLPKLDLVAVPDFAAGAMENWGAITFRENLLLYYPRISSMRTKQRVAEVISHELAHQWFGNLVTMRWWNDLWLNESFATYMATKLLDDAYPEWDLWGQFLMDVMRTGMDLDSLQSTHPIDVPVDSPAQIREIFDPISYDKGGCILHMLENYVGKKSFRAGLTDYLTRFKYGNASGEDLWTCIGRASAGKPVSSIMRSWLRTPGFPVVSLGAGSGGDVLHARQERCVTMGATSALARDDSSAAGPDAVTKDVNTSSADVWPIPLSIRATGQRTVKVRRLLDTRTKTIRLPPTSGRRNLVTANPGRTGFYRVNYDGDMLLDMRLMAGAGMLDDADLWSLENDLFALCMAGRSTVRDYLDVAGACSKTGDYAVLADIAHNMSLLHGLSLDIPAASGVISGHASLFFTRVHNDVAGWTPKRGDPPILMLLRGPTVLMLGRLGNQDVGMQCGYILSEIEKFFEWEEPIPSYLVLPDLIEAACSVAAWNSATEDKAESVRQSLVWFHNNSDATESKMRYLGAMCGFDRPKTLSRVLDFALSNDVRSQNTFVPITKVSENPYGRAILWPWVRDNWDAIAAKIGRGNPLLGRVVASLANACDESDVPHIRDFFAAHPVPGTERTLMQTVEKIKILGAMRNRLKEELGGDGDAAGDQKGLQNTQ